MKTRFGRQNKSENDGRGEIYLTFTPPFYYLFIYLFTEGPFFSSPAFFLGKRPSNERAEWDKSGLLGNTYQYHRIYSGKQLIQESEEGYRC